MEEYLMLTNTLNSEELIILTEYVTNYRDISRMISSALKSYIYKEELEIYFVPEIILNIASVLKNTNIIDELEDPLNIILIIRFNLIYLFDSCILPMPQVDLSVLDFVITSSLNLLATDIIHSQQIVDEVKAELKPEINSDVKYEDETCYTCSFLQCCNDSIS